MRILHAIHDFLPRHQAGSEIYAFELCRVQAAGHHVSVLCGEYDHSRRHGQVTWRVHEGLPVVELVNNQVCASFEDTYRSPLIGARIAHVLHAVQPDVVHVHNLLNLSFDLPAMAHARGIPVVATLHDYALVCPTGGQRIHRAEQYVCRVIDTGRCVRCFRESPHHAHMSFGNLAAATRAPGLMHRAALAMRRRFPEFTAQAARAMRTVTITKRAMDERLAAARRVFDEVDLFVAPSPSMAEEFLRLGVDAAKLRISD
jgi:glycosyltransferase involved in cell wall biosynthesis